MCRQGEHEEEAALPSLVLGWPFLPWGSLSGCDVIDTPIDL